MQYRIDNGPIADIPLLAAARIINGSNRPTLSALRALADWLTNQGLADVSISVAWQIWVSLRFYRGQCAESTLQQAQIAYWYKLDSFTLSESQQVGLLANLPRMQCQERIYRRDYDPADYESVYQLFKCAYDDEDLAQRNKAAAFALFVDKRTRAT